MSRATRNTTLKIASLPSVWRRRAGIPTRGLERVAHRRATLATDTQQFHVKDQHGIRGDTKGWGSEKDIIMYYPSLAEGSMPDIESSGNAVYRLIDFHEPGGLWENRGNPNVFQENEKGQAAFVILDDNGKRIAGSANPPWGWEDFDDRHDCGIIATDPARLVYDYLDGFPEFSLEYIRNPYLGIGV